MNHVFPVFAPPPPFQNKTMSLTTDGIQSQWEEPVQEEKEDACQESLKSEGVPGLRQTKTCSWETRHLQHLVRTRESSSRRRSVMCSRCSATPFQNKSMSLAMKGIQSQWEAPVREQNNTDESRATTPQVADVEKVLVPV